MIQNILNFLNKKALLLIGSGLVLTVLVLAITIRYPITFRIVQCKTTETAYNLHETTYRLSTLLKQSGGATVRLCIQEVIKTHQNNLVEIK